MFVIQRQRKGWVYYYLEVRFRDEKGRVGSKSIYLGPDPVITWERIRQEGLDPQEVARLIVGTVRTPDGNHEITLPIVERWDLHTMKECDAVWEIRELLFEKAVAYFSLAILLPCPQFPCLEAATRGARDATELAFENVRKELKSLKAGAEFLEELYSTVLRTCREVAESPPTPLLLLSSHPDSQFWQALRQISCESRILTIMDTGKVARPYIELARHVHAKHQSVCPACAGRTEAKLWREG